MRKISFKYCPLCSGKLESGKLVIPKGHLITDYVWWYSEKNIVVKRLNECIGMLHIISAEYYKKTTDKLNIPAGYCKNCDRIFAEFSTGYGYKDKF